jgi:hypothetical protein
MLLGIGVTGCGSRSYVVTRTGTAQAMAKAPDCDFAILTASVDGDYEQVTVLEREDQPAVTAAEFQKIVGKQVCELGGDAVLAEIDNQGAYLRGTVLIRKEAPAETAVALEPSGEAPVAPETGAPATPSQTP